MKKYTFQDLILDEESDIEYYRCSEADKYINLYEKLKGWHKHALTMQAKMADQLEPLYNQIEDLEEQNKEMLELLETINITINWEHYCDLVSSMQSLIKKIESTKSIQKGEQNG